LYVTTAFFVVLFGVCIGSFLNVVIYRLPSKKSIVFPSSCCVHCDHKLSFFDLIPLLSFLFLKGKCRYCSQTIGLRYFLVELLTGMFFLLAYYLYGFDFDFFKAIVFVCLLIVISFIDLDLMIIPDELPVVGILLAMCFSVYDIFYNGALLKSTVVDAFVGGGMGAGIMLLMFLVGWLVYRQETLGGGDVKMMFMVGLFLGAKSIVIAVMVSILLGGIIGGLLVVFKIKSRKDFMPFGPFLALGSVMALFFSVQIETFYYGLIF
jgi:leader peptidase (prepilin peptidase) / N-methyltransferase